MHNILGESGWTDEHDSLQPAGWKSSITRRIAKEDFASASEGPNVKENTCDSAGITNKINK